MAPPPIVIPCQPWCTPEDVQKCCNGLTPDYDLTDAIAFASEILYRLSGRQFPGECIRTVWPCFSNNCGCSSCGPTGMASFLGSDWSMVVGGYPSVPLPSGDGTGWINCSGGGCGGCCIPSFDLPATINSIDEIIIDGETLDPETYAIKAYRSVVRTDGQGWPCSNNLAGDVGDPGTWTVTYSYGKPVPAGGKFVAAIFACQIALSRCGGDSCLPARLKSISRQDVELDFADPLEFLDKGQVGIYEVDMWLESVNPGYATSGGKTQRLRRRSRMHRPDGPRGVTTYTG